MWFLVNRGDFFSVSDLFFAFSYLLCDLCNTSIYTCLTFLFCFVFATWCVWVLLFVFSFHFCRLFHFGNFFFLGGFNRLCCILNSCRFFCFFRTSTLFRLGSHLYFFGSIARFGCGHFGLGCHFSCNFLCLCFYRYYLLFLFYRSLCRFRFVCFFLLCRCVLLCMLFSDALFFCSRNRDSSIKQRRLYTRNYWFRLWLFCLFLFDLSQSLFFAAHSGKYAITFEVVGIYFLRGVLDASSFTFSAFFACFCTRLDFSTMFIGLCIEDLIDDGLFRCTASNLQVELMRNLNQLFERHTPEFLHIVLHIKMCVNISL